MALQHFNIPKLSDPTIARYEPDRREVPLEPDGGIVLLSYESLLSMCNYPAISQNEEEILTKFETLRQQKTIAEIAPRDDYWGLMDPENARVAFMLIKALAQREEPVRILVLGTGVGLLEALFLQIPTTFVDTIDIIESSGKLLQSLHGVDIKNRTYQVKPGQKVGMFLQEFQDSHRLNLMAGDALAYVSETERTYDAIFVDDNHDFKHVYAEIEAILKRNLLNEGGVLFADNISAPSNPGPLYSMLDQIYVRRGRMFFWVSERTGFKSTCAFTIHSPLCDIAYNLNGGQG